MASIPSDNVPEVLASVLVVALGTISYLYTSTKKELKETVKNKDIQLENIISIKDLQVKVLNEQIIKIIEDHNEVLTQNNASRSKDIRDITKAFTEISVIMNQIKPLLDERASKV